MKKVIAVSVSKLYSKIINIGVFDRIRNQQSRIFLNTIYIVQKQIRTGCSCCKLNISLGYCLCISICPVLSDVLQLIVSRVVADER